MSKQLDAQRVLVVGGAKHLGEAVARSAAAAGAHVIIGARDLERARALAADLPEASAVHLDVADETTIRAAAESLGGVDHLVVTASAHHNVPVPQLERDGIAAAFEAKIIGPMLLAKHFAPRMPETGSFLLFSGTAAWNPAPGLTVMGVTNGAVSFLASHLAKELAPLRVNALSPGITDSGTWDGMPAADRQGMYDGAAAGSLAGRVGTSDDIAEAAVWLLGASYVSGETIHVDGGSRHA
jgi:NAD(P)-dependent dehydrogenase (short-subunit alcohol dehydrogenase family)